MGHEASNDQMAVNRLHEFLLESAGRANSGTSLAFQKIEEIVGESFSAVLEFIPDYEHAAALCSDIDPVADQIKANLAGQNGRDAIQVRLQSLSGARSECYITMYIDKASQRVDKPRPLQKLKAGYLQDRELEAGSILDMGGSSPEGRRHFLEGAGSEPVNLLLDAKRGRRVKDFQHPQLAKSTQTNRPQSLKPTRHLRFDNLYALCERNFPDLLHIRGFPFCRNLQKFSSSGGGLKASEQGEESDVVRISYVAMVSSKAEEVASEMVCAADGIPDFRQILHDIKRTAEAVISRDPTEIHRVNPSPNTCLRMVPFELTASQEDAARERSQRNDGPSTDIGRGFPSPPHIFTTGVVRRSRAIYWSPSQPPKDIKAQIIVALIQLRLLADPSSFVRWLEQYVLQNFKIMAPPQARKPIAMDTISNILSHHGLTEDFRSWRKYVHFCLDRASRDISSSARDPEGVPDPRSYPSSEESSDEGTGLVGSWTVADCARKLDVSRQYANRLIRRLVREGKLTPLQKTPLRISESHVDMLLSGRKKRSREQKSRIRKRKELEQKGWSFEAARKLVNRKRGRLPPAFGTKD